MLGTLRSLCDFTPLRLLGHEAWALVALGPLSPAQCPGPGWGVTWLGNSRGPLASDAGQVCLSLSF